MNTAEDAEDPGVIEKKPTTCWSLVASEGETPSGC
jgi:hypothetical protein